MVDTSISIAITSNLPNFHQCLQGEQQCRPLSLSLSLSFNAYQCKLTARLEKINQLWCHLAANDEMIDLAYLTWSRSSHRELHNTPNHRVQAHSIESFRIIGLLLVIEKSAHAACGKNAPITASNVIHVQLQLSINIMVCLHYKYDWVFTLRLRHAKRHRWVQSLLGGVCLCFRFRRKCFNQPWTKHQN